VDAAVDVAGRVGEDVGDGVDDRARLERGRGAVEVGQAATVGADLERGKRSTPGCEGGVHGLHYG
jgi:hypothetical protein